MNIFNSEVIGCFVMIEARRPIIKQLLPIVLIKIREECLELSLQVFLLDHGHQRIVVQHLLRSRLPIKWFLRGLIAIIILFKVFEPSDKEVQEVLENLHVQLLESPILPGPDHSWQVELVIALVNMDYNLHPVC